MHFYANELLRASTLSWRGCQEQYNYCPLRFYSKILVDYYNNWDEDSCQVFSFIHV